MSRVPDVGKYVRQRDDLEEWHFGARVDESGVRRHPEDWKDTAAWTHCICFGAACQTAAPLLAKIERLREALTEIANMRLNNESQSIARRALLREHSPTKAEQWLDRTRRRLYA